MKSARKWDSTTIERIERLLLNNTENLPKKYRKRLKIMRSKRIVLHDAEKLTKINPETAQIMQRYKIDMSMRNLSPRTQSHYTYDLEQWFIYIYDRQQNRSVTELIDDDITEFIYFCMSEGNNSERIKLRLATISAFYRFMRKKKLLKNAGMALEDVSTLLNHESTATTKKYYIKEDTARLSSIKRTYNI